MPHSDKPHSDKLDSKTPDSKNPDLDKPDLDSLMQDKLETHCRQQLSAMLDGTLAPDQARFLLRRLQHDDQLAGCWERWQVYGDLMRGSVPTLLPADFSQRVQAALADDGHVQAVAVDGAGRPARWAGWAGGAALAASVAVAALFVTQRAPVETGTTGGRAQLAASTPAVSAPAEPIEPPRPAPNAGPSALDAAATVAATALAAAEAPRRAARRERSPARATTSASASRPAEIAARAAPVRIPEAATAEASTEFPVESPPEPAILVAGADRPPSALGAGAAPPATRDLFVDEAIAPPRPWPRPILPAMSGDAFTVDYGGHAADDGGFDYFDPQLPADPSPR